VQPLSAPGKIPEKRHLRIARRSRIAFFAHSVRLCEWGETESGTIEGESVGCTIRGGVSESRHDAVWRDYAGAMGFAGAARAGGDLRVMRASRE